MKKYLIIGMFLSLTFSVRAMQKDCNDCMLDIGIKFSLLHINARAMQKDFALDGLLYMESKEHPELLKHCKTTSPMASMVPVCSLPAIALATEKKYVLSAFFTALGLRNLQLRSEEIFSDIDRLERLKLKSTKK